MMLGRNVGSSTPTIISQNCAARQVIGFRYLLALLFRRPGTGYGIMISGRLLFGRTGPNVAKWAPAHVWPVAAKWLSHTILIVSRLLPVQKKYKYCWESRQIQTRHPTAKSPTSFSPKQLSIIHGRLCEKRKKVSGLIMDCKDAKDVPWR